MNNSWQYIIGVGVSKLSRMRFSYTHWGDKTSDLSRYPQLTVQDIELASKYSVGDVYFDGMWTAYRTWGG